MPRRPEPTFTVLCIAVAGLLGAGAGMLSGSGHDHRFHLASAICPPSVTVIFLQPEVSSTQAAHVARVLEHEPGMEQLRFASQADDYFEFTALFPEQGQIAEQDVPPSFRFVSDTPSHGDQAEEAVQSLPGVWHAEVIYPAHRDRSGVYFDPSDLMRKSGPTGPACRRGGPPESVAVRFP